MNALKSEKPFKVLKVQSTPTSPASINTFNHSKYSKFSSISLASLSTLSSLKTLSSLNDFIRKYSLLICKKIVRNIPLAARFVLDFHYERPKMPVLKALSRFTLQVLSDVAGNLRQFSVSEGGFCGNFIYAIILLKGIILSHLAYKLRGIWGLSCQYMAKIVPFIPHLLRA